MARGPRLESTNLNEIREESFGIRIRCWRSAPHTLTYAREIGALYPLSYTPMMVVVPGVEPGSPIFVSGPDLAPDGLQTMSLLATLIVPESGKTARAW